MSVDSLSKAERGPILSKDSLLLSVVVCSSRANCPFLTEASARSLLLASILHVN